MQAYACACVCVCVFMWWNRPPTWVWNEIGMKRDGHQNEMKNEIMIYWGFSDLLTKYFQVNPRELIWESRQWLLGVMLDCPCPLWSILWFFFCEKWRIIREGKVKLKPLFCRGHGEWLAARNLESECIKYSFLIITATSVIIPTADSIYSSFQITE